MHEVHAGGNAYGSELRGDLAAVSLDVEGVKAYHFSMLTVGRNADFFAIDIDFLRKLYYLI